MTPEDKQLVRELVLRCAHAAGSWGIAAESTRRQIFLKTSFNLDEKTMERELHYLVEKGLLELKKRSLSAGAQRYVITAGGIELLEAEGLA